MASLVLLPAFYPPIGRLRPDEDYSPSGSDFSPPLSLLLIYGESLNHPACEETRWRSVRLPLSASLELRLV